MTKKRKKTSREKRALIGALCTAAVILAGSTFAWFTSSDEVTNRLSASANYGVTIAEDFTPPENLVPGQKVNKDVSVVNTGNIDALVRVHLEGAMNVLKENAVASEIDIKTGIPSGTTLTDVADADLIALGLTKKDASGNFYRTLSKTERPNPKLAGDTEDTASDSAAIENSEDNTYSEVKTVQAGGYLAYASGAFKFTPENAGYTYVSSASGNATITQTAATEVASTAIKDSWTAGAGLEIDSDTFVPTSSGLFIFRRNITLSNQDTSTNPATGTDAQEYEFSGYYADVDTNGNVTYYALHYLPNEPTGTPAAKTYHSDYVIYSTAQTAETDGNALTVTYETNGDKTTPIKSVVPTSTKAYSASYTRLTGLVGTYAKDTGESATTGTVTFTNGETDANKKVQVVANVANIGTTAETWTPLTLTTDPKNTYFYYNNDVEEGDSTAKLVDSVELDKNIRKSAYLALDFDLNVVLDSVQVTVDEAGKEDITAAKEEWTQINKSTTVRDDGTGDIALITWKDT